MKKALIILAHGFEEVEALTVVDALIRGNIKTVTASITDDLVVQSSHGVKVFCDAKLIDVKDEVFDVVFLPGGMPGSINLAQSFDVNEVVIKHAQGKIIAAICAAPAVVFGPAGLLEGKKATCYPGCESYYPGFNFSEEGVVRDGNLVTAKSAAYAWDLGFTLVEMLEGKAAAEKVKNSIYFEY